MYKEWKYKEMVTMQAGGLLLTRRRQGAYAERGKAPEYLVMLS